MGQLPRVGGSWSPLAGHKSHSRCIVGVAWARKGRAPTWSSLPLPPSHVQAEQMPGLDASTSQSPIPMEAQDPPVVRGCWVPARAWGRAVPFSQNSHLSGPGRQPCTKEAGRKLTRPPYPCPSSQSLSSPAAGEGRQERPLLGRAAPTLTGSAFTGLSATLSANRTPGGPGAAAPLPPGIALLTRVPLHFPCQTPDKPA